VVTTDRFIGSIIGHAAAPTHLSDSQCSNDFPTEYYPAKSTKGTHDFIIHTNTFYVSKLTSDEM